MGAHNIDFELADCSESEVLKAFKARQLRDREYNGHQGGYSGDFQTVHEVKIENEVFETYEKAYNHCLNKAEKWDFVVAVRYKKGDKLRWLIAGWGAC